MSTKRPQTPQTRWSAETEHWMGRALKAEIASNDLGAALLKMIDLYETTDHERVTRTERVTVDYARATLKNYMGGP